MRCWFRCVVVGMTALIIAGCGNDPDTPPASPESPPSSTTDSGSDNGDEVADAGTATPESNTTSKADADGADPAADTPDALMQKTQEAMQAGDFERAITTLEKLMKSDVAQPDMRLTLAALNERQAIELATQGKRDEANPYFLASGKHLRMYLDQAELPEQIHPQAANMFYNEACGHAHAGNVDAALASLQDATKYGFTDVDQAIQDPDLAEVVKTDGFKQLIEDIAQQKKEHVQEQLATFESYPFDFKLKNLEGEEVTLDDFQGKVTIVDFWGTWCPPCRKEIPHFLELKDEYGEKGFEVVGINYEQVKEEQVKATIERSKEQLNIDYPLVIGDSATRSQVPNFEGFPTTLFIDREGKVRLQLVGYHPYSELEAIVTTLLEEEG